MMRLNLLITSLILLCFNIAVGQRKNAELKVDSLFIYKDFNAYGTTARLWYNHNFLDSTGHETNKLNDEDFANFKSLFSDTKSKKLHQMKYGGKICYLIIYSNGRKFNCVAMSNGSTFQLDDLDGMRYWFIENETKAKQLNEILNKYWR